MERWGAMPRMAALAGLLCLGAGAAGAQDIGDEIGRFFGQAGSMPSPDRGALLFHGNYCGPGNRAPAPPVDALDRACMHHDACSPDVGSGRLPACGCNRRLRAEARLVARDPRQPQDLRVTAQTVADGALLLPCR